MNRRQSLGGGAHGFIPLKGRNVGVETPTYKGITSEEVVGWAFCPTKSKMAFTLAEVLITLGIIGIVAALTLPTIIRNYNVKITETRLKKFYSTMNQAVTRLKADYGDTENWTYWISNVLDDEGQLTEQSDLVADNFRNYFGKYIDFVSEKEVTNYGKKMTLFYFKDGSAIMTRWYNNYDYEYFPRDAEKCLTKLSNERRGVCSFAFQFRRGNNRQVNDFVPYAEAFDSSRPIDNDLIYEDCRSGTGQYCGLIIMLNNWTVPKDYPRKLAY